MPTVLLVDDSPVAQRALSRRLIDEGLHVHAEATAADAERVDLADVVCAIVDVDLPDASGFDLAARLLARKPELPVAFYTAGSPGEASPGTRPAGPVFHKPDVDPVVAWAKERAAQPPPTK